MDLSYHCLTVPIIGIVGRGGARAKAFFDHCLMDEFLSGRKYGYLPWEYECVSKTARDSFCDDDN